jgi:sec-independent protein translocase protein TatB
MFDIAWGEFILIAVVALIVIGPKELPAVLRAIGQWTVKIRRMAAEFQGQFQEALREAEMADLRKEVDSLNEQTKNFTSFDPVSFQAATKSEAKSDEHGESAKGAKPHVEPALAPSEAVPELAQAAASSPGGADDGPGGGAAASQPAIEPQAASEPPGVATSDAVPPPPSEGGDGKGGEGGVRP